MQDSTTPTASRRAYLKAVGAVSAAGAVGLAGCSGDAAATGALATAVTDQPGDIADFDSCVVTIQGIWLKPASDDATETATPTGTATGEEVVEQSESDVEQSDAREYHEFDEPAEADLVDLQNGNTSLVDEREVTAQRYEFLQLDVTSVEGTLAEGGDAQVDTPGNAPLQFKQAFEVREDQTTRFTADFTPVKRGQGNRYLLQPVATGTEVSYEDSETATSSDNESSA
jgi:hypothetical protein